MTIKAKFTYQESTPVRAVFSADVGGTRDHSKLVNRELPDQHPISAITGLETALGDLDSNIGDLDSKVDGINLNLTQQIEETQQDVTNKYNELLDDISDLSDTVDDNYDELDGKIDSTANTINQRITDVADELNQTIEENVVALQREDTALQNQINAHSQTLTSHGQSISANTQAISTEVKNRQDADDELQDQIDNLEARGRFLALWNASTGLAMSNPKSSPYTYKSGDYFIVGVVGTKNYKPTGTQYIIGQASTVEETEELATDDVYYFDGATWHLQINHGKTVSFSNLAGQPSDNTALKNALDSKQNVITDLATIRSDAQAGKDASDTISGYGDIVTHNVNEFAKPSDIPTKTSELTNDSGFITSAYHDNTKQDKLTAGTGIDITNNVISNTQTSAEWGKITGNIQDQTDLADAFDNKTQVIIRSW